MTGVSAHSAAMRRTLALFTLAFLVLLGAPAWAVASLGLTLLGVLIPLLADPGSLPPDEILRFALMVIAGSLFAGLASLSVVLARNLLRLRLWAWQGSVVIQAIAFLVGLGAIVILDGFLPAWPGMALNIVTLLGLLLPPVRRAFAGDPTQSVGSRPWSLVASVIVLLLVAAPAGSFGAFHVFLLTMPENWEPLRWATTPVLLVLGVGAYLLPWNLLQYRSWAWIGAVGCQLLGVGLLVLVPLLTGETPLALLALVPALGLVLLLLPGSRPRQHPEPVPAA